jgi:tetratricopeptide (TPR) repeat protein
MPKLEPVDFNGVLLGESTLDEVLAAWGEPRNRTTQDGVIRLNYVIEPFSDVEVTFFNGRATAIVIDLGETFSADAVAKELGLEGMPTVAIDDSHGKPLGLVFPERGVAFRFTGDGHDRLVTQIGLDRIDPRPFVLRAERRLRTEDQGALNDADTALSLDANLGRAHYVRGQVLRAAGRRREAMAATETALKLEPKSAEYLLARGQLLADEGLFDAAMQDTEAAVQAAAAAPHLQARAWSMRGDFLAGGPERDYVQAIDAHTRAIRLAEPLLKDERVAVRRAAREVLVEAHLGTADDIAWGEWAQKETVVPKWLTRAEKLAADGVKNDGLPADLLPTVYHRALTAAVGTQGKVDPKPWAEKLLQHTDAALVECTDPMRRTRLQYDTGFGLYDALQAAHARGNVDEALRFGTAAVERIQPGRAGRDPSPIDGYRYGRLYFRVGSLYAVGRQDHATAVEWFERAAPLLERPLPEAAAADRGRQGETLVSMGISYWALGKRERAIELTTLGTRIMQASVEAGMLEGTAMVVAYGNLSTMHEQMGDPASGKRYAEMATRLEASGDTLRR